MMTKQEHTNHLIHELQKLFNESLEVVAYEKYITIRSTDYNTQNRDFILAIKCSLKDGEEPIQSVTLGNRIDPKEYAPLFQCILSYQEAMKQEETPKTTQDVMEEVMMESLEQFFGEDDSFRQSLADAEQPFLKFLQAREAIGKPIRRVTLRVLPTNESFTLTQRKSTQEFRWKPTNEKKHAGETCAISLEELSIEMDKVRNTLILLLLINEQKETPFLELTFA